jgi:mRNA-degrading endonuclease HigB of HigAB toxin-antitoxin module
MAKAAIDNMIADLAIFNIRGNHYRLIVRMVFSRTPYGSSRNR